MKYLQGNHPPLKFTEIITEIAGNRSLPGALDKHLCWEELEALCKEKLVTLGAHTVHHYPLTLCDRELANSEISDSRKLLEERLPIKVQHFSYPRGHQEDFNDDHIVQIKTTGFVSAVSTIRGTNRGKDEIYRLKRIGFPQNISENTAEFLWYVAGIPQIIVAIKKLFGLSNKD